MKLTKQIVGVGLLTLVGTSFALAHSSSTSANSGSGSGSKQEMRKMFKEQHKSKKEGRKADKKVVHDAIIAGDFTKFKVLATSTPIGKIDQATFNNLSAQMKIIQAAKAQVDSILKAVGVERPFYMGHKSN